jgi:DNA-binding NarL/FixJ family response regulator
MVSGRPTVEDGRVGRRLLIVDDHAGFRASARRTLSAHGFDIVGEAEDGASALELARELRPEVMLIDLALPDTDGFALSASVHAEGLAGATVLTSSRDWSDVCARQRESGAVAFVPKNELSGTRLLDLVP